ncbi:MAG TPA: sigma-70 family RNA polymerase sigma factor [Casimicrobiaceae bacterium]|nr:sigma-70 family RNA polymerase sigma factor [Casimicrobiaceae bacterium]
MTGAGDGDVAQDKSARLAGLLARTALADQIAFSELYRLTSSKLYGVALRIVRDRSAAEEVLQEAYVAVWHHAGSYVAAKSAPLTWLTAIVRNRCLDSLRRREVATVPLDGDDDSDRLFAADSRDPAQWMIDAAEANRVRTCVESLESGMRQAIALAFFHGLTHAELAAHLGQPLGTVKSWVRRGLERLRQCLERAGITR